MNIYLVGGSWTSLSSVIKQSGIVNKIEKRIKELVDEEKDTVSVYNGGQLNYLPTDNILSASLTIWMPDISNEEKKHYPNKNAGTVLICSKVMREGYKDIDAISRIFKMHGNAVIAIYKKDNGLCSFDLLDALGNSWYKGSDINSLVDACFSIYRFTKESIRVRTQSITIPNSSTSSIKSLFLFYPDIKEDVLKLIDINKQLQKHIQISCGNRYFGNISTRCSKLFPTVRLPGKDSILVSPRNTNKESLEAEDMIYYVSDTDKNYYGVDMFVKDDEKKPSIDSPMQIRLYKRLTNINFMIHGHATVIDAPTTENYRLCGDIRETEEVLKLVDPEDKEFVINLKNHGFLIGSKSIKGISETLQNLIRDNKFKIK